ncbi:MAG: siroheme synthase CysG [Pseudomonadota bacterium]
MEYLPVFLKLRDQKSLVVGGGKVAARKIAMLIKAGSRVTVIAPKISSAVQRLAQDSRVTLIKKTFTPDDIALFNIVISATSNSEVNAEVSAAAQQRRIPVNVVDNPTLCSFIFPAIVDRTPVIAAVSSGGASPVLSRLLRARLESLIPAGYGDLARFAEHFRKRVQEQVTDSRRRRIFWEKVLQGGVAEMIFAGREADAERHMEHLIRAEKNAVVPTGEVALVGAGPGDPDLLTFRALRLMQQADVVVYDRLVSPEVLELVRRDAERIYAGKERDRHTLHQEAINDLLARLAKAGKRVVRLKGGDPFIFGRGGEEIETLLEQGINFQVVPGITAASGCASYAGIPLTHRDHAQSCVFVTGHRKDGSIDLNWAQLVNPHQTLVIYMGLLGLEEICQALIEHGASPETAAALIQQGTTRNQRVFTGTVATLAEIVAAADIKPPTLVIVGSVVTLHDKLAWFRPDEG